MFTWEEKIIILKIGINFTIPIAIQVKMERIKKENLKGNIVN